MSHLLRASDRVGWLRKIVVGPRREEPRSVNDIYRTHESRPDKKDVKERKENKDSNQ